MQSSGGCDGERSYQVLSCEVRASDEVASICQEGEERPNKGQTCLAEKRGTPADGSKLYSSHATGSTVEL